MELNRKVRFGNAIRYFVKKRISLTKKNLVGIGVIVFIGLFIMPALAADRFADHGDGTVTDTKTGLMWATKDNGSLINWPNALSYCQNYGGGGYSDWRMPAVKELTSIVNRDERIPAVNADFFPQTEPLFYWTSTVLTGSPNEAWSVRFLAGL